MSNKESIPPTQQEAAAAELYNALYRLVHDEPNKSAWVQARAALAQARGDSHD